MSHPASIRPTDSLIALVEMGLETVARGDATPHEYAPRLAAAVLSRVLNQTVEEPRPSPRLPEQEDGTS